MAKDVVFHRTDHAIAQQLTYIGTTPIHIGSILVIATTTGPFYGRVTAINGQHVITAPATLGDIFTTMDLSVSSVTGTAATKRTPLKVISSTAKSAKLRALHAVTTGAIRSAQSSSPPIPAVLLSDDTGCSGSISPTVSVGLTASAGTFSLQTSWNALGLKSASITDDPSFGVTANASVSGTGSCTYSEPLFDTDLPTIEFVIGYVPVWITESLSGDANGTITADGTASIALGYSAQATLGASKPNHGSWGVAHTGSVTKTVNTTLNINATATLELPVTYEAAVYGMLGFDATANPFAELNVNPPACRPPSWLTLAAGLKGSVDAVFNLGSLYNWSQNFGDWTFFSTNLIDLSRNCPPITTSLDINTINNVVQATFVPSVASGNTIPIHSTVIFKDVGTAYKYGIVVHNPNGSGTAFNVKPTHSNSYVLPQSGTYFVTIQGGIITNGTGTINKHLTITVP